MQLQKLHIKSFNSSYSDRRGVLDSAALQALAGESVLEKERQLSEMIMQLQMVREQLLAQQEHNKGASRLQQRHSHTNESAIKTRTTLDHMPSITGLPISEVVFCIT
ncbi:unnamed protein product [Euphydryas editha]|uniref:Uncharacterized protein n=1 Tax=Euphydryas editha TaxID=104508 RepID=A0AAU9TM51_EUPED|nr:unnamed protein product [Euphydryas editha]